MERNEGLNINEDRIISIDMIRGFCIFGIYMVNMMDFHSPLLYLEPFTWWTKPLDHYTYVFIDIFAQASFYPLFSILFGYSLVLQLEKVKSRGLNFTNLAFRRLGMLLFFGIIHAFFVWHGDILIQYAILGFLFLFFINMSGRKLLQIGIGLYGIPAIILTILIFLVSNDKYIDADVLAIEQSINIYSQGTFMEIVKQHLRDWRYTNNLLNFPFLFISIFPLFLIGAGIAKQQWLEHPGRIRKPLSFILVIMLGLGLLLKGLPYMTKGAVYAQYAQDSVGGLCLAVFYGGLIIKISEWPVLKKWLNPLAAVGRMSISNYLFQSLLSSFIFNSYGFGLYGKVSLISGTVLVFVVFSFQILLSNLWFRRFSYGPVEWVWGSITYLKLAKIRRQWV